MFSRVLITALLTFVASVADHALPVYVRSLPVLPSFLDLALLLACLHLRGGESVFWAGAIGLLHADFSGSSLSLGIFVAATLGLVCQLGLSAFGSLRSIVDRAIWGAALIALLLGVRVLSLMLVGGAGMTQPVLILLIAKLAATYLLFLLCQSLLSVVSMWRSGRRNFHEFAA